MNGVVEIFVGLLLAVAVLALVARRLHIPYPRRGCNIISDATAK